MRRSLRFFSSCSSSSVMGIGVRIQQQKVVARHAAQNHSLQAVEIVKSILRGFAHRGQEWFARIFPQQPQQLPQGKNHHRSEEHTSELQSPCNLVCRLLLEKKKTTDVDMGGHCVV